MKFELFEYRNKLSAHGRKLFEYFQAEVPENPEDEENPYLVIYEASMEVSKLIREFDELIEDLGLNK
jgi:hypothetical protein